MLKPYYAPIHTAAAAVVTSASAVIARVSVALTEVLYKHQHQKHMQQKPAPASNRAESSYVCLR